MIHLSSKKYSIKYTYSITILYKKTLESKVNCRRSSSKTVEAVVNRVVFCRSDMVILKRSLIVLSKT